MLNWRISSASWGILGNAVPQVTMALHPFAPQHLMGRGADGFELKGLQVLEKAFQRRDALTMRGNVGRRSLAASALSTARRQIEQAASLQRFQKRQTFHRLELAGGTHTLQQFADGIGYG